MSERDIFPAKLRDPEDHQRWARERVPRLVKVADEARYIRLGPHSFSFLESTSISRVGASPAASNSIHSALAFPPSALSQAYAEFRRPVDWVKGLVTFTVHYTSDAVSSFPFSVSGRYGFAADGAVIDSGGSVFTAASPPGPSVAFASSSFQFADAPSIDKSTSLVALKITRLVDSNPGTFLLTQVTLQYVPRRVVAQ